MTSALRSFLQIRREELEAQKEPLARALAKAQADIELILMEIAELEAAEKAIGMVNGVQTVEDPRPARGRLKEGTIKDFVVQVLSDKPGGMVALDILTKINERFGANYPRTSLSPQLSRLKQEGLIDRRGLVWYLKKNKGGPDLLSEPPLVDLSGVGVGTQGRTMDPSPAGSTPVSSTHLARLSRDLLTGTSRMRTQSTSISPLGRK